uniref:Uncharacterized protein n=1 Tax=Arcella intermedia TaxID=1963864 RepID=A0A6B2LER3_9EUKA
MSVVLAVVLIVGTLISYIPQYVSIFKSKSSEGLSFLMMGLGLASSLLTLLNTVMFYWEKLTCCSTLNFYQCLANNLVPEQLSISPICLIVLYLFFLYYFDKKKQTLRDYVISLAFFAISMIVPIIFATAALLMYFGRLVSPTKLIEFARLVGLLSAILVFVQWAPQVITTLRLGKAGALSLPMLLIQCPGSFLVVGFQLTAPLSEWTTWSPSLVSGLAQALLIILILFFKLRTKCYKSRTPEEDFLVPKFED